MSTHEVNHLLHTLVVFRKMDLDFSIRGNMILIAFKVIDKPWNQILFLRLCNILYINFSFIRDLVTERIVCVV